MANGVDQQPVQSLWIGKQLSKVEQLCIQSFLDHGHDFHLYTYEELNNVPAGAQIHDARAIIAEDKIFRFKEGWGKGSVSGFADLFRLLLLKEKGGWWVDMDIICLKPFLFNQETIICSSYEGEYGSLANNCVIKAPKDSPLIDYCIDELAKTDIQNMSFGSAGPFLFQKAVKELRSESLILPYQYFNPISWKFIGELLLGKMTSANKLKEYVRPMMKPDTMPGRRINADSYAVHFWNEVWNANGFDKNGSYANSSLFEILKRKHGIR
jgi:hypothetical protein